MTDPSLGWVAWESGFGGYGHVSQHLRKGLQEQGATFVNAYTGGWGLLMAVCTPAAWLLPGNLKRSDVVIHTMFETEPLPPGWTDNLNKCGLIWTPSQYCFDLFQNAGVTTPIFKVGYGVEPVYEYVQRDPKRDGRMRFGVWGENLIGRKNVLKSVWAWLDAALPEAELEVKVNNFAGMNSRTAFADKHGKPLADITLHMGDWPRPKLIRWLQSLDCLIYLSAGEGYGLMPLEAAATGCPVIVHNCTGMTEYANSDCYLLVESKGREKSVTYSMGYGYQCTQFKPDWDQAVEQIRWAYHHRVELADMGYRASEDAHARTWGATCAAGWQYMKDYYLTLA